MPIRVPLKPVARQQFSFLADDTSYTIDLKDTRGAMCVSATINDVVTFTNIRFFADAPLIPYLYQEGIGGNFILTVLADALPAFAEFDVTQLLYYLSAAEVADARS